MSRSLGSIFFHFSLWRLWSLFPLFLENYMMKIKDKKIQNYNHFNNQKPNKNNAKYTCISTNSSKAKEKAYMNQLTK